MALIRGQKLKLSALTPATDIDVGIACNFSGAGSVDITCFGVDANSRLSDDRYFIFYNQKNSPQNEIIKRDTNSPNASVFSVSLGRLPQHIQRLVFTAAIDGAGSMSQLAPSVFSISVQGREVDRYDFDGRSFQNEKAIIVAELYLKGEWRLGIVGQGFNGGLSALLKHYGGEEESSAPPPPPQPYAQPAPAQYPPQPQQNYSQNSMSYQQNGVYSQQPENAQNFANRYQPTGIQDNNPAPAGNMTPMYQMAALSMGYPMMMGALSMGTLACPPHLAMMSAHDPGESIVGAQMGVLGGFNRAFNMCSQDYAEPSHADSLSDRIFCGDM
ncbi:TerD family protein [bacterium]|nr:TerD family protein [bacterium]